MPALNWDKTYQRRLVAPRKVLVMHVLQEYMSHLCMYEPSIVHMIVNLAFEGVQGGITALSPLMNCMFSETEHADRVHPLAYPIWGLGPRLTGLHEQQASCLGRIRCGAGGAADREVHEEEPNRAGSRGH